MGLDVLLVPKNRDEELYIPNNLSRCFCNFLCGPGAFKNNEFSQVQQLLRIDLSIFLQYGLNCEFDAEGKFDYKIYLAEKANDKEKVRELKEEREQERKEWEETYDSNNEGWTIIEDLEEKVIEFITKINLYPNYHEKLKYNFNWGNYFYSKNIIKPKSYRSNNLLGDLDSILDWIKIEKTKNVKYVTFTYG